MNNHKQVLGLLPSVSDADVAINNLTEADVKDHDISVIANDEKTALQLSGGKGKYTGIFDEKQLEHLQIAKDTLDQYQQAVTKGAVLLVVSTREVPEEILEEMLKDQRATNVVSV